MILIKICRTKWRTHFFCQESQGFIIEAAVPGTEGGDADMFPVHLAEVVGDGDQVMTLQPSLEEVQFCLSSGVFVVDSL